MADGEPNVFEYLDARVYLREFYSSKKRQFRGFSYRAFSKRAGLRSPNYLKLYIDGQRNLTLAMAHKFARGCQLGPHEQSYFVDMVMFTQARNSIERDGHYQRLVASRFYRRAHRLDVTHAAYHSTWYIPAIRELITTPDFQEDPAWIACQLIPSITKSEAEAALKVLWDLGMLCRDRHGKLRQVDAVVSTGPETTGLHIGNYHRTMLQRAAASIDDIPAKDRDISSLTVCLSDAMLIRVKECIQALRQEILELSVTDTNSDRVVQINFQMFPMSRSRKQL